MNFGVEDQRAIFPNSKRGPAHNRGLNIESRFTGKPGMCVSTRLPGKVVVTQQGQYLGTKDPRGAFMKDRGGGLARPEGWKEATHRAGSFEPEQRQEQSGGGHHHLPDQVTMNVATSSAWELVGRGGPHGTMISGWYPLGHTLVISPSQTIVKENRGPRALNKYAVWITSIHESLAL